MSDKPNFTTGDERAANLLRENVKDALLAPSISSDDPQHLDKEDRAYFRAELKQRLHRELRRVFKRLQTEENLTYAEIARRLDVNRSVITKRLKGQCNLTLDILSDMFRAMGTRLEFRAEFMKDIVASKTTTDAVQTRLPFLVLFSGVEPESRGVHGSGSVRMRDSRMFVDAGAGWTKWSLDRSAYGAVGTCGHVAHGSYPERAAYTEFHSNDFKEVLSSNQLATPVTTLDENFHDDDVAHRETIN
jgi:transcriptional regulator with XRE-family HTH domain